MSWIAIAITSAAIAGVVHILEKIALYRYLKSPLTLPLLIGITQLLIGTILVIFLPWDSEQDVNPIMWSVFSGVLHGIGGLILLRMLYVQEVSRVIPIFLTFPIFAALIAVIFLDEQVTTFLWIGIVITVFGAVLLSTDLDGDDRRFYLHPSFIVLMIGSILTASGHVTSKIAVADLGIFNVHALRSLGACSVLLLFGIRKTALLELRDILKKRSPVLFIFGIDQVTVTIVLILVILALSLGPVSLVTTIGSTRSLFVLLYVTILTIFFPKFINEDTSKRTFIQKLTSSLLIVSGVGIITLT